MLLERGNLLNNRYRVVEILGQGGMGAVYRAVDENLDIEVAVKDNFFTAEEFSRQFRREATILARLRHPSLPRVTDYFEIPGQGQYLVMDFIEGEDLRERMDRIGSLPEQEVVLIGAAICNALVYLGECSPPVIHRDIKPGNIKVTPTGEICLVDFGLAKTLQGSQITTTGARAMTPGYSPPEQYGTARTDMRTDVFSLGATLYAVLTGIIPEESLARGLGQAELTPIRTHNPKISKRLAAVIEKALEIHPDDRYQTPEEFKQALLSALPASRKMTSFRVAPPPVMDDQAHISNEGESGPLEPSVSSSVYDQPIFQKDKLKPKGRVRRSTRVFVLAAFFTLSGLFTLIFFRYPNTYASIYAAVRGALTIPAQVLPTTSHGRIETSPDAKTSTAPPATATNLAEKSTIHNKTATVAVKPVVVVLPTSTSTPVPTPIGGGSGQIAFASLIDGVSQIFMVDSDGEHRVQITSIQEGACQPEFSPDGMQIIFTSPCASNSDYYPNSSLYIINIDGSGLLPLPTMYGGDFDPAWSPDGKIIAFTSLRANNRPQIFSLDLTTKAVTALSEKYMLDSQPAWTPDGKQILFVSERSGKRKIWIMDADGSNSALFTRNTPYQNMLPSVSPLGDEVLITQYLSLDGIPRVVTVPLDQAKYAEYEFGKEKRPMRHAVMSPDGVWVAFEGWEAGKKHNIYLMTTTGISITQITDDLQLAFDPVWRPVP